jgi:rhamnogalacturonan endolyase
MKRAYEIVARLDPASAPEGDYFNSGTADRDRERRYFPGWYNDMTPWGYRNQASHLQVAFDKAVGARVLEWKLMHVRYLLNTDPFCSDLLIRARLRMTTKECVQYHDIPDCTESRLGIVWRYEDHRHFYFFAIEGLRRLVVYRRENEEWTVLAQVPAELSAEAYYELSIEATGDSFECVCGIHSLRGTDHRYTWGRWGIRGNSLGKIAAAEVAMTPGQKRYNQVLKMNAERQLERVRQGYPGIVEARRLDFSEFSAVHVEPLRLQKGAAPAWLLSRIDGGRTRTMAVDWDLTVLWERNGPLGSGRYTVYRDAPNGHRQLICLHESRFEVIDLVTGQTIAAPAFPRRVQHTIWPLAAGLAEQPGNVQGNAVPGDLLLRYCDGSAYTDDKARLMVLDEDFNEIWSVDAEPPGFGHTFGVQFFDVDGDGRDEVLAGYQLLCAEGNRLWRMEAIEDMENRPGAGHIDFSVMGDFAGDKELDPTVFVCSGGVYVVDGRTGRTRAHQLCGHTQGGKIGNFRPDLPGLELAGRNRWGSMGIVPFVNGRGMLTGRMHPDPIGNPGGPVNWTGDGQELVFISSYRGLGLYDGWGRKVVELPVEWCNEDNFKGDKPGLRFVDVLGDTRDELLHFWRGVLTIYTQDGPPLDAARVYAPRRQGIVSWPGWRSA